MSGSHPASRDMDMLHGPVARKMLVFALPVALTGLFQQLFTAADILVLGRFVGKEAMAAAGNNIPAISLIINLYTGLALGANVVIARCIGSGDRNGTRSAVQTAVLLSLISGIAIAAMGVPLARTVTELLGVPEEVFTMSEDYLRIYFYGIPALAFFNFAAAILRSRGDTRTPLFALIQSTILNIVLNLAFVKAGWGLGGVVWATDIANYWAAESINSLGADAMAASAAAFTVEINVYCVIASFGQAVTTFVSQNYGAGNLRRCRLCTRTGIFLDLCGMAIMSVFCLGFAAPIIGLFSSDPEVIRLGVIRVWYVVLPESINVFLEVLSDALRGYGISTPPALIALFGICGFRLAWIFLYFPHSPTFETLMAVFGLSWAITAFFLAIAYVWYMRRLEAAARA